MAVPLILMVLAQCTASLSTSREYHFVNLKKNWLEAQAYCREHFLDLATMETQKEWVRVNQQMVENSGGGLVWMGLYDDVDDWRWSVDGAPLDFTEIASLPQRFNEHNNERHCVSWWNGHLHDHECNRLFNSVCYNKSSDSYVPVLVLMTWESAQQHCREMHMDLTSLRGQQEQDRVSGVVDASSHWWIGLSRGPHKWSDGSNSLFRAWYSSEPSSPTEDCGCMLAGSWHDCSCAYELPFICTVPYWTVFRAQLRMAGSVDLNEAQIRDGVEMEIENNLRDWGIRPEFKVKWMKQANGEFLSKNVTRL